MGHNAGADLRRIHLLLSGLARSFAAPARLKFLGLHIVATALSSLIFFLLYPAAF
jgi:hypothetical protein